MLVAVKLLANQHWVPVCAVKLPTYRDERTDMGSIKAVAESTANGTITLTRNAQVMFLLLIIIMMMKSLRL